MEILIAPFVNALFAFYKITGNLGMAIVAVTLLIRMILMPILLPSLRSAKRMRQLQPELKKIQDKYKDDKTKLAQAQMDFYREKGLNPTAGCLPQIFQIGVLLVFYNAFNHLVLFSSGKVGVADLNKFLLPVFRVADGFKFNLQFLGTDLSQVPSKLFASGNISSFIVPAILLVLAGAAQYLTAKVLMPTAPIDEQVVKKETPKDQEDDMMAMMRTQSTYVMPIMTIVIGWNFAVGLILYWLISSAAVLLQQVLAEKIFKI